MSGFENAKGAAVGGRRLGSQGCSASTTTLKPLCFSTRIGSLRGRRMTTLTRKYC